MCDIKTLCKEKTRIVYKVVYRDIKGNYYAIISGMRINLGLVSKCIKEESVILRISSPSIQPYERVHKFSPDYVCRHNSPYYNPLMTDRTCGFSSLSSARRWIRTEFSYITKSALRILKIKLGGSIYKGTSARFLEYPIVSVYAGSEILSFKEVE